MVLNMKTKILLPVIVFVVLCTYAYFDSRYILTDNDQVVITQFSKVVDSKDTPGEYFKIPIIQKVQYFTKKSNLTEWEQKLPTRDKKYLTLKTKVFWKITDLVQYYCQLIAINGHKIE